MQPITRRSSQPFALYRKLYRGFATMISPVTTTVIASIVIIMLTACQPILPPPADVATSPTSDATKPEEAMPAATIPEVTLEVSDTEITIPADFPGGIVAVTVKNTSSQDLDISFGRIREGSSVDEIMTLNENFMENVVPLSQMAGFMYSFNPLPAGETGRAIMDFKTGEFMIDATAHVEGEPEPGAPHIYGTFEATTIVGTVEPQADVKVDLTDFAVIMPDEITAGSHLWEFNNVGQQWHMLFFVQPIGDASLEDVMTALMAEGEPAGPPPFEFLPLAGVPPIGEGERVWIEFSLEPGLYIGACPLPDMAAIMAGGAPMSHLAEGMHRVLTVTSAQ